MLAIPGCSERGSASHRALTFEPSTVQLRELEFGETASFQIQVHNPSPEPVEVLSVVSSCSCTLLDDIEEELGPGEKRIVDGEFTLTARGVQSTQLRFLTSAGESAVNIQAWPARDAFWRDARYVFARMPGRPSSIEMVFLALEESDLKGGPLFVCQGGPDGVDVRVTESRNQTGLGGELRQYQVEVLLPALGIEKLRDGMCNFTVVAFSGEGGEVLDECEVRVNALPEVQIERKIIECAQDSESARFSLLSNQAIVADDIVVTVEGAIMEADVTLSGAAHVEGDYGWRYIVEFPVPNMLKSSSGFRFKVQTLEPRFEGAALCRIEKE